MKALQVITNKQKWAVWLRAFRIWQRKPHEVAPLSTESHDCCSCGTTFTGNYCPRCGQSARIGRFSFKKALLLFIDVWGLGNRSMFRSLRDLILRPGYMIRDYIGGKQSAYFPPFKMFFLLTALSLLVEHGFSFGLDENKEDAKIEATTVQNEPEQETGDEKETVQTDQKQVEQDKKETTQSQAEEKEDNEWKRGYKDATTDKGEEVDVDNSPTIRTITSFVEKTNTLRKKNPAIFSLFWLIVWSLPLFIFFRTTPNIPKLRYPEFVVSLVYTSNMYSLISVVGKLLSSNIFEIIAALMVFVALKQFSGYSKLRLLGYIILSSIITVIALVALIVAIVTIVYYFLEAK